jgi:hypothetical protein
MRGSQLRQASNAIVQIVLAATALGPAAYAQSGTLRVGTAKVDITPTDPSQVTTLWEVPFTGIHDRTYARVIVLDNGATAAAIVAIDTVELTKGESLVDRIAKEAGIPASNIILAASHDHSAPMWSLVNAEGQRKSGPGGAAFLAKVSDDLVAGVGLAKANMQPARVGAGCGTADVNINRDELTPHGYIFGRNPSGPSDKTVWVMKFESLSGEPLALLVNYAVHATVIGPSNSLLSGDLPGAMSRYVEQHYGGKVVALWTSGAAGDQHPVIFTDGVDTQTSYKDVDVLGQILGEEAVRVADGIRATNDRPEIWGREKFTSCPGKKAITGPRPDGPAAVEDTGPVGLRLGVLMIDKTALTQVSAEVVTRIYWELRQQSPYTNTILMTLVNGRAGYIPDDASYDLQTQEAVGSSFKRGCGEATAVNGLLELLRKY